ncbi:unnamed protein product, partial [Allacma fusca]
FVRAKKFRKISVPRF